ncbi:hypothetical protein ABFT23_12340 [Nocardioides sp. C4-1]|uniref:DUF6892 domain-containing protein n=1 Tax=Nocardioides sp. C4-1 TaxID=3151851 RepID=UPI0032638E81
MAATDDRTELDALALQRIGQVGERLAETFASLGFAWDGDRRLVRAEAPAAMVWLRSPLAQNTPDEITLIVDLAAYDGPFPDGPFADTSATVAARVPLHFDVTTDADLEATLAEVMSWTAHVLVPVLVAFGEPEESASDWIARGYWDPEAGLPHAIDLPHLHRVLGPEHALAALTTVLDALSPEARAVALESAAGLRDLPLREGDPGWVPGLDRELALHLAAARSLGLDVPGVAELDDVDSADGPPVEITADGITIDGRLLTFPVVLAEVAEIFGEPAVRPASARLRAAWWWREAGITAATKDDVHAESFTIDMDKLGHRVRIDGRGYRRLFAPHGSTYESSPVALGKATVMAARTDPGSDQHVQRIIVDHPTPRRKRAPAKKAAPKPAAAVDAVEFADLNLKLAVVQVLMYERRVIEPVFDIDEFVASYDEREIDLAEEGYDPIPEALAYFADLPVARGLLEQVDAIHMDGGNDIYLQVAPHWGGDDDAFDVRSWDDVDLLPNLRTVELFGGDEATLEALRRRGIDARLH